MWISHFFATLLIMPPRKKTPVKDIIRQVHLYLGLTSGIIMVIVALTGSMLVFEEESRELFQHSYYHVAQVGEQRVPLQQMRDTFKAHYPKEKINSIRFKEEKDAAFVFYTKGDKAVSIDPYTANIIGVRNLKKDFFGVVEDIHRHLLLGDVGDVIIACNVLIFFIMCITGLVLWWPKQKRFFKQAVRINFKTKNWKRFNWDLHSVLGFYALLILFIISLTGLFFAFDTVKDIARFLTHEPKPKKEEKLKSVRVKGTRFTIDDAYQYMCLNYAGAKETFINPPTDSTATIRVIMRYPYAIVRKQNSLYFDQYSGKILKTELYKDYTAYNNISRSNRDFHTGAIHALGIGSKIIYFFAALIAASLPITGFLIWWGRQKKTKKKQKVAVVQTDTAKLFIHDEL